MQKLAKRNRAEKLQLIQAILNGNFDFELFSEPKHYQVTQFENEDSFTVYCVQDKSSKQMNLEEYEQWHSTLKDSDIVFLIRFEEYRENEPLKDESQIQAEYEAERIERIETQAEELKPVKRQKKQPEKEIEVLKVDDNYFPLQPLKTSGKLSEYGDTWRYQNN